MTAVSGRLTGRPLPIQAPTAFVRIRPLGARVCGQARRGRVVCRVAPGRLARQ
jgi:hypothetical protein